MGKSSESAKHEKFFFNVHNFDEPEDNDIEQDDNQTGDIDVDFVEPPPPPPAIYTEEQLKAAEDKSFNKGLSSGKQQGIQEARELNEAKIATCVQNISDSIARLKLEQQQSNIDDANESVALTTAMFEKAFPVFNKKHGFTELKMAILSIIEQQRKYSKIVICVSPDTHKDIKKAVKDLYKDDDNTDIAVEKDDNLKSGACNIRWEGGGAHIDRDALVDTILETVKQTLARTPTKSHDNKSKDETGIKSASLPDDTSSNAIEPQELQDEST